MNVDQAIQAAIGHHQAGRLVEAEKIYRQVFAEHPNQPDALHLLGLLVSQMGRHDAGIDLIRQAIAINATNADYHNNLGTVLRDNGKLDEAIASFNQAIQLKPDAAAYNNLGTAMREKNRLEDAVAAYRQAISRNPRFAQAHNNLGNALKDLGQLTQAIAAYRRAIQLKPDYAGAYGNLSIALREHGEIEASIMAARRAIALRPDDAQAHSNLANSLTEHREFAEAITVARRAIELKPDLAKAHSILGSALANVGEIDQAIQCFLQALRIKPDDVDGHYNLGTALSAHISNALGGRIKFEQSIAALREAIQLKPDYAQAHWNLGLLLLLRGELEQGWPEYEWRWKNKQMARSPQFSQPRWNGDDLAGKTILLYAEQGFGDTIQFARYVPMVAARGGEVLLCVQPELCGMLSSLAGVGRIVPADKAMPHFDLHYPLLSLPMLFGTTLQTIPAVEPYLTVDPVKAVRWRERLPTDNRRKIGLVWAGRAKPVADRSLDPSLLKPLAEVEGTWFCSLQHGEAPPPAGLALADWTDQMQDFSDTAALISNLDLVITVDTAVAHLAGALGKRVWVMLRHVPDWRWLLDRTDSPWYPTMRLFR
jgi:tetratricopeptide (TPR) repeat protein